MLLSTSTPASTPTTLDSYGPWLDLRINHPDWRISFVWLHGRLGEVVVAEEKLLLVDPLGWDGDEEWAYAHALSHLDLHGDHLDALTEADEREADRLAHLRLGRRSLEQRSLEPQAGARR